MARAEQVTVALDCETVPPVWAWPERYQEDRASGGRDWRREVARELCWDWWRRQAPANTAQPEGADPPVQLLALKVNLAMVASVALHHVESGADKCLVNEGLFAEELAGERGERDLLARVSKALVKAQRLVTWNGRRFDLPLLIHRMVVHEVTVPAILTRAAREKRYSPNCHVDLMDGCTFYGTAERGHMSMRAACLALRLGDPKAEGDGAAVFDLVRERRREELEAYNLGDVAFLAQLYQRWVSAVGV